MVDRSQKAESREQRVTNVFQKLKARQVNDEASTVGVGPTGQPPTCCAPPNHCHDRQVPCAFPGFAPQNCAIAKTLNRPASLSPFLLSFLFLIRPWFATYLTVLPSSLVPATLPVCSPIRQFANALVRHLRSSPGLVSSTSSTSTNTRTE